MPSDTAEQDVRESPDTAQHLLIRPDLAENAYMRPTAAA